MTGFEAVKKVYDELVAANISIGGNIFQYAKPPRLDLGEFIVLNVLPVPDKILQQAFVNCNIFVKDVAPGVPDNDKMEQLSKEVLALLPISRQNEDIHVFLEFSDIVADSENDRHYVNLRFEVLMLNN